MNIIMKLFKMYFPQDLFREKYLFLLWRKWAIFVWIFFLAHTGNSRSTYSVQCNIKRIIFVGLYVFSVPLSNGSRDLLINKKRKRLIYTGRSRLNRKNHYQKYFS